MTRPSTHPPASPPTERLYAVDIEGGWLTLIEAPSKRDAERAARRDWAWGSNLRPADVEAVARIATADDISWHKAMGGHGGYR